jgi:2-polyprenyl-3-methyl-5-hydroxy-6-metoxy-1,4-benzoquinol methylase
MQRQIVFGEFDGKIRVYFPRKELFLQLNTPLSKAFKKFYVDANTKVPLSAVKRFLKKWRECTGIQLTFDQNFFELADYYSVFSSVRASAREQAEILLPYLKENNSKKILDVGCGQGELLDELNELGFDAEGIDQSGIMVSKVKNIRKAEPVDFLFFGTDEKYDSIVMIWNVLLYFKSSEIKKVFKKANSLLNNGGQLIIEYRNLSRQNFSPTYSMARKSGDHEVLYMNKNRLTSKKLISSTKSIVKSSGKIVKKVNHVPVELAQFPLEFISARAKEAGFYFKSNDVVGFYKNSSPSILCVLKK